MNSFAEPKPADSTNLVQTRLDIGGMTCGGCARRVAKSLRAVPGVASAEVDLAGACAVVLHDPGRASPPELAHAVERAGYDVLGTRA